MRSHSLLLDTNLLVLFVVGTADRDYIGQHKRLRAFTGEDFDMLFHIVSQAPAVFVTPNTLTETSNLASQIAEPARSLILRILGRLITATEERYIPSRAAAARTEYVRLGLTDAALLEVADKQAAILTTDHGLYRAALASGVPAFNFNHIRDHYL